jgi:hypothetical protein
MVLVFDQTSVFKLAPMGEDFLKAHHSYLEMTVFDRRSEHP